MRPKEYRPLTNTDKKWITKTLTPQEIERCELIWGGVPLYDELFVRNSPLFLAGKCGLSIGECRVNIEKCSNEPRQ